MLTLLLLLATPRGAFALYPPSVHHASCTNASSLLLILDTFSVPRISVDVILFCLSNHIKTFLSFFLIFKLLIVLQSISYFAVVAVSGFQLWSKVELEERSRSREKSDRIYGSFGKCCACRTTAVLYGMSPLGC